MPYIKEVTFINKAVYPGYAASIQDSQKKWSSTTHKRRQVSRKVNPLQIKDAGISIEV